MIGVQLNHEIIIGIAIMVIKESKVALFALGAARPALIVVVRVVSSRGDHHAMFTAPPNRFGRWILIREPGVMRVGLTQHGFQSFLNNRERLGRRFRYNHRYPIASRHWKLCWHARAR